MSLHESLIKETVHTAQAVGAFAGELVLKGAHIVSSHSNCPDETLPAMGESYDYASGYDGTSYD